MVTSSCRSRVLVADDEQIIADTVAQILELSGFTAVAVYSGEQALEAAKVLSPDILITDVIMGGMNGIQTASRIQKDFPSCRIILFSGHAATANLLLDGDRFEILCKPIHPTALVERCHKLDHLQFVDSHSC